MIEGMRVALKNWLTKPTRKPEGFGLVREHRDVDADVVGDRIGQHAPNIRVQLYNALNGRVIQIFTPAPANNNNNLGYDVEYKSELYLLTEDELLSAALTKLLVLKINKEVE